MRESATISAQPIFPKGLTLSHDGRNAPYPDGTRLRFAAGLSLAG